MLLDPPTHNSSNEVGREMESIMASETGSSSNLFVGLGGVKLPHLQRKLLTFIHKFINVHKRKSRRRIRYLVYTWYVLVKQTLARIKQNVQGKLAFLRLSACTPVHSTSRYTNTLIAFQRCSMLTTCLLALFVCAYVYVCAFVWTCVVARRFLIRFQLADFDRQGQLWKSLQGSALQWWAIVCHQGIRLESHDPQGTRWIAQWSSHSGLNHTPQHHPLLRGLFTKMSLVRRNRILCSRWFIAIDGKQGSTTGTVCWNDHLVLFHPGLLRPQGPAQPENHA